MLWVDTESEFVSVVLISSSEVKKSEEALLVGGLVMDEAELLLVFRLVEYDFLIGKRLRDCVDETGFGILSGGGKSESVPKRGTVLVTFFFLLMVTFGVEAGFPGTDTTRVSWPAGYRGIWRECVENTA